MDSGKVTAIANSLIAISVAGILFNQINQIYNKPKNVKDETIYLRCDWEPENTENIKFTNFSLNEKNDKASLYRSWENQSHEIKAVGFYKDEIRMVYVSEHRHDGGYFEKSNLTIDRYSGRIEKAKQENENFKYDDGEYKSTICELIEVENTLFSKPIETKKTLF